MGLQGQVSKFVFLVKVGAARGRGVGEPSQLPEIKYESQTTNPFSLYGLTGVGLAFRRSGGHRNLGDAGKGEPSQPSETKYE